MTTRYAKTMRDAIAEVWANDIQLDEGKMKTIATMFDSGKSPEAIAKAMKLPLATVKSILGEEDLPEQMLWEFTDQQIAQLKKEYAGLKGAKISLARANQLRNIFDKISNTQLPKLYKADIPFLSTMALTRMIKKGIQVPKGIKLSAFEQMSWEQITETHTSDQSSKNIQKDKNENAPSEADIDRLKKQGLKPVKEFKKMSVEIGDDTKRKKAIADLRKKGFEVTVGRGTGYKGEVLSVDGKGADLNKYATDLKNFYGAKVVAEETELKEYAEYIEYMCKSSSMAKQVANMFKGKIGGGELSASGSEVRVDSAKDVENIHKQVVAKFGDDVRVITKEEFVAENANVMKGVDDYIKIGQDKFKNHPSFKDLYTKQKRDLSKSVGPKYIKIHNTEMGQKRSIHAFIDKQTGDLYKPAGVNAPAKGVRGNVTDKDFMNKLKMRFDVHGGHLYARDPYKRIFGSVQKEEAENGEVESGKIKLKDLMKGKKEKAEDKEEKSKESIDALKDQVALLKQKLEIEKNKAVKPEPNPDTGEVPLSVGLAQKLLRDKEKKEVKKEEVQEAVRIVAKNGNFKKTFQTRKQAADYLQNHPELDDAKIIAEADLTKSQIKKVHKMADELPKKSFRDRYGKEKGDAVRYGTATNMVKKKEKIEMKNHPAKMKYEEIAGLRKKADKSGMPYGILKKVYDRGMAAWKGGHRPGASQHQWAFARVNSFVTKSSGTWGGADKDLAAKVKGK